MDGVQRLVRYDASGQHMAGVIVPESHAVAGGVDVLDGTGLQHHRVAGVSRR
jgi:hypothetical protein